MPALDRKLARLKRSFTSGFLPAEKALVEQRLKQLEKNPKHWGDHHHLVGTTAEVTATPAQRGNYTLLASPEPEGWPEA